MLFNKKAYTVAEVAVAAGIFMIFAGAVFSLFRMGSNMYVSGSWKYNQQKEAERFFQVLRERVEQASELITIDIGNADIERYDTNFVINSGKIDLPVGTKATARQYLAQFAVCKPRKLNVPGTINGLALCHALTLIPNNETGLYDLCLHADRNNNDPNFFNTTSANNCMTDVVYTDATFDGPPTEYGLPNVPNSYYLRDVCSVSICASTTEAVAAADIGSETWAMPAMFMLNVTMRNPKHPQTVLEMSCRAKIDGGVNIH